MFCPDCGKEYYKNQNFCRYCGANLTEECTEKQEENVDEQPPKTQCSEQEQEEQNAQNEQQIDLTVPPQENRTDNEEQQDVLPEEENNQNNSTPQIESETTNEQDFIEKDCNESLFTNLKNNFVYEKDGEKHLTTSAITLLVVLLLFIIFMFNLLWSINDAIQINPSMTNENALMNIPNDNEDGAYTQAPEPKEEQEEENLTEQSEENHEFAEQKEEPPIVPIEEIRQMEQQFPEPEIPMPQEYSEDDTH